VVKEIIFYQHNLKKYKMKKIYLILYYSLINKIPNSTFLGTNIFNKLRIYFVKKIMRIGSNNTFQRNVYFGNGNNVVIGNNCQINDNIRFDNVKIGDNVMIARDCIFLGKTHNYNDTDTLMTDQGSSLSQQTIVENNVWIGLRVIIMPGVKIKKGSIISAGSVLHTDTVLNGVYAGIPARLIKVRGNKE